MKHTSSTRTTKPTPAQITSAAPKPKRTLSPAPHRELTPIQAEIAAEMAGMILHGGHRDDVELVLRGLMQHQYRRKFFNGDRDPALEVKQTEEFAERFWANWFTGLAQNWPPPKSRNQHESVSASAPMQMFHANMRGELMRLFNEFISDAENPESVWFLKEVFGFVDSGYALADAFAYVIDNDATYVSVPPKHVKLVNEYIQLLDRTS